MCIFLNASDRKWFNVTGEYAYQAKDFRSPLTLILIHHKADNMFAKSIRLIIFAQMK